MSLYLCPRSCCYSEMKSHCWDLNSVPAVRECSCRCLVLATLRTTRGLQAQCSAHKLTEELERENLKKRKKKEGETRLYSPLVNSWRTCTRQINETRRDKVLISSLSDGPNIFSSLLPCCSLPCPLVCRAAADPLGQTVRHTAIPWGRMKWVLSGKKKKKMTRESSEE